MAFVLPATGVVYQGPWCVKAWKSFTLGWLVHVEHDMPERGGWIRGWLSNDGNLLTFPTLDDAVDAMAQFLEAPDWHRCLECPAGVP